MARTYFLAKNNIALLLCLISCSSSNSTIASVLNIKITDIVNLSIQNVNSFRNISLESNKNLSLINDLLSIKANTIDNFDYKEEPSYSINITTFDHYFRVNDLFYLEDGSLKYYWKIIGTSIYDIACQLAGVKTLWDL